MPDLSDKVSDERLRAIIDGCEGGTPGPYRVRTHPSSEDLFFVEAPPHVTKDGVKAAYGIELLGEDTGESFYPIEQKKRDAAHVARLDPATVASIVAELLAYRTRLPASSMEGWRLVPEKPTQAMLDAVTAADQRPPFDDATMKGVYVEMLAASPIPPKVMK